jgi:uncharacterized protein YdbL (DUF1318 family)
MRIAAILAIVSVLSLGCARVRVEAPEKPIKVDISMRLDIYQHIEKDIDAIEGIVSGSKEKATAGKDNQSFLGGFVAAAYAQDTLDPEVEAAAYRRRDRRDALTALEAKGVIGENKSGLLTVKQAADASAAEIVNAENSDRMIIYQGVAKKNGSSVEDVEKLYAKRLQADSPAGTPIETEGGWVVK